MRKQLKVLLLVATVLALFVMAMIVGSAAEVEVADGAALVQAVANAQEGATIKLTAPITLDAALTINKAITLDGNGKTITSTAEDFMFVLTAEDEKTVTLKNFTASAAGSFVQFFGNGAFVFEDVIATCAGQLIYSGADASNLFMSYSMEITNCTLTSTMAAKGHLIGHAKRHVNKGEKPNEDTPFVTITVTNTTITAATDGGNVFKVEQCELTLDSCTVNAPNSIVLYSDTYTAIINVKSESAPFKSEFDAKDFVYVRPVDSTITIGRKDESDDIKVTVSDCVIIAYKYKVAYTFYGGTYTSTGTAAMFQLGLADDALTISNANIISNNGAPFFGVYTGTDVASTFTAEYCEFKFVGTSAGFVDAAATNATVNYEYCVFVVTAAPADVALFGANDLLDTVIVLAPAGAKLTADKTLDSYAKSVKYAAADYKLYAAIAGAFENSAAGAGLYVDSTADASGLRFETTISKTFIDKLLADTNKTIADLKFYTLIAPMDYVAAANGIFTKASLDEAEALEGVAVKYVAIEAVTSLAGIEGGAVVSDITYNGALVSLNSYTRAYAAVSMIEYVDGGNTVTLYGDFDSVDNARAAKQVADNMIEDATSEYNTVWAPATAPQKAVVDKYATGIVD